LLKHASQVAMYCTSPRAFTSKVVPELIQECGPNAVSTFLITLGRSTKKQKVGGCEEAVAEFRGLIKHFSGNAILREAVTNEYCQSLEKGIPFPSHIIDAWIEVKRRIADPESATRCFKFYLAAVFFGTRSQAQSRRCELLTRVLASVADESLEHALRVTYGALVTSHSQPESQIFHRIISLTNYEPLKAILPRSFNYWTQRKWDRPNSLIRSIFAGMLGVTLLELRPQKEKLYDAFVAQAIDLGYEGELTQRFFREVAQERTSDPAALRLEYDFAIDFLKCLRDVMQPYDSAASHAGLDIEMAFRQARSLKEQGYRLEFKPAEHDTGEAKIEARRDSVNGSRHPYSSLVAPARLLVHAAQAPET
jgi:hypothetical protein